MSTKNNNSANERLLNVKKQKTEKHGTGFFLYVAQPDKPYRRVCNLYIPLEKASLAIEIEEEINNSEYLSKLKNWVHWIGISNIESEDTKCDSKMDPTDVADYFIVYALKDAYDNLYRDDHIENIMKQFDIEDQSDSLWKRAAKLMFN